MTSLPNHVGGHMISYPNHMGSHMSSLPNHMGGHMTNPNHVMLGAPVGRSDSFRSTESSNSMEYRGTSQLEEDPHMMQGARYLAPSSQLQNHHFTKKQYDIGDKSHDFQDNYLMRADEIRMKELRGHGASRDVGRGVQSRQREEVDGYPISNAHVHNRGHTHRDHPAYRGAVPVVLKYGPKVHLSHSKSVDSRPHHTLAYDSDPPYAVPPSRPLRQQLSPQQSEYHHPAPPYAAPPPPTEKHTMSPPLPPLHSDPMKGSVTSSEHRLHVLPLTDSSSATEVPPHPQNHIPSSRNRTDLVNSHNSIPDKSFVPPPSRTPAPSTATPPTIMSPESSSSLNSPIGSEWSLAHIQKYMEKQAQGFDDMLTPPDEGAEGLYNARHEGSEGVDWDMPTGPHMTNGHHHHSSSSSSSRPPPPHKTHKPPIARKPHLLKAKSPPPDVVQSSGLPRAYSSSSHGYSTDEDPKSIAINKKRPKVPDLTSIDPRRPRLKVKRVQGSVWQPKPMNRAIQSSSEEDSEDSCCSRDTVVPVSHATDTLRSAHV